MAELDLATARRTPRERVCELIEADFPGLDLRVGDAPEELDSTAGVRAVVVPAVDLPQEPPAGLDFMAFPAESPVSGAALLFREGDEVVRTLRRFYLPPVVLAGAGPGGLSSMTVAATRALSRADLVLADCLCGTEVLDAVRPGAEIVSVGKRCGAPSVKQDEINTRLLRGARRGQRVVRLKGGDPSVFGRLEEEIDSLRGLGVAYRVIAGVGAASGAAAFIGQPLTVREIASEVIFSTGRLAGGGKNPFPLSGGASPSIALYMSRRVLGERMADLKAAGYTSDTPVVVVEKVGSPAARAVYGTIDTIDAEADRVGVGTPAIVLVGRHLRAPDHLPLTGLRIWLPAERETAETHREALEELGATCVLEPLIEPAALPVNEGTLFAKPYDWVLFTSKKSVDFFFALLSKWGFDSRWLPKVAAIGDPTIEKLRARGIEPDLIPPEPARVSLSKSLIESGLSGKRILIPASAVAPDHVRASLLPHAEEVVRVDLYTIRYPEVGEVPPSDVVLFSSETTVRSAKRNGLLQEIRDRKMVVGGIGPGTCGRLEREGLPPAVVPRGTSPESLARAARRYFATIELAGLGNPGPGEDRP